MSSKQSLQPPGPRTPKGERKRQQLLSASRSVFEEKGYFETRIVDIVERSQVALGSVYRYFSNKDDLLLALLEDVTAELYQSTQGVWEQGQDPLTNLERTTASYLAAFQRNRRLIRAMLQMTAVSDRCAATWWDLRQKTYRAMARHLPPGAAQIGDPELVISALGGMVDQYALRWYIEAPEFGHASPEPAEAGRVLAKIWHRAAYGDAVRLNRPV